MMQLTQEQFASLQSGQPVHVTVNGADCVLVRADVFAKLEGLLGDSLPPAAVTQLVEQTMADYDAGDPLLASYQQYKP